MCESGTYVVRSSSFATRSAANRFANAVFADPLLDKMVALADDAEE
jgi:hypothetical protein